MFNNPAVPVLVLNGLIIGTALAIALVLQEPLAILALFWIQSLPLPEYEEGQDGMSVVGQDEESEYSGSSIGFGANLKK